MSPRREYFPSDFFGFDTAIHARFFPSPSANADQSLYFANSLEFKSNANKIVNVRKNFIRFLGNINFIIFIDIIKTKLQETKGKII